MWHNTSTDGVYLTNQTKNLTKSNETIFPIQLSGSSGKQEKNPAKRRSALNLQVFIDYYIKDQNPVYHTVYNTQRY